MNDCRVKIRTPFFKAKIERFFVNFKGEYGSENHNMASEVVQ